MSARITDAKRLLHHGDEQSQDKRKPPLREVDSRYMEGSSMFVLLFSQVRLPPEVNRVLYVRNLPYKITGEEMYDIFGKYGAIRQIRV